MKGKGCMETKELKQKLRKLKLVELRIRYGFSYSFIEQNKDSEKITSLPLLWKEFFCFKDSKKKATRYSFSELSHMNKEQIKRVFDEFWLELYYRIYQNSAMGTMNLLEPELLSYLGLPFDADDNMVKKRFRKLCKDYHPDQGGDEEKFCELMNIMEKYDKK